jgi:branched-chain amino acid transport system permease protein
MFNDMISADGALHIMVSFAPILMTMVGGVASFFGPICGAGIFGLITEFTTRYTERVELVSGVILIMVILFFPLGFMGLLRFIKEKWFTKR